jgi:hypothetical protein
VFCEGQALGRDEDEQLNEIGFDDIGGCNRFVKIEIHIACRLI